MSTKTAKATRKPKAKPVEPEPATTTVATIERRHEIQAHVATGKATLKSVVAKFGESALRSIAKQTRFGRYAIVGIKPDNAPHNDPIADITLAAKLAKLKPATAIKQLIAPPRRSK